MSIEPVSIYQALTFNQGETPLWTIQGPLSGDLMAGLIVGINTIFNNLIIHNSYIFNDENLEILDENGRRIIRLVLGVINPYREFLRHYIIYEDIAIDRIGTINPEIDDYSWWIFDSGDDNFCTLFSFVTSDFIQGFISICAAFGVDFRNYIFGTPFRYIQGTLVNYRVEGYDIIPFNVDIRVPAPIGAYYIDRNEGDSTGHDFN